jgi:hypothetical protein
MFASNTWEYVNTLSVAVSESVIAMTLTNSMHRTPHPLTGNQTLVIPAKGAPVQFKKSRRLNISSSQQ